MSHSITPSITRQQAVAAKVTDMMEEKPLKRIMQSVISLKNKLTAVCICLSDNEFSTGGTMDMESTLLWMCQYEQSTKWGVIVTVNFYVIC